VQVPAVAGKALQPEELLGRTQVVGVGSVLHDSLLLSMTGRA